MHVFIHLLKSQPHYEYVNHGKCLCVRLYVLQFKGVIGMICISSLCFHAVPFCVKQQLMRLHLCIRIWKCMFKCVCEWVIAIVWLYIIRVIIALLFKYILTLLLRNLNRYTTVYGIQRRIKRKKLQMASISCEKEAQA